MRFATKETARRGLVLPLMALLVIPIFAVVALAVEISNLALIRSQLQAAADSAAVAGASRIVPSSAGDEQADATAFAKAFAESHRSGAKAITLDSKKDVSFGFWDSNKRTFEAPRIGHPTVVVNAIRVRLSRDKAHGHGEAPFYFAPVVGIRSAQVSAEAIALVPTPMSVNNGPATRFLLDEDVLDTGHPNIQKLAASMNTTPDHLLMAANEKSPDPVDWFLNLPPNVTLEVRTGSVGDEGLLDIAANESQPNLPQYPFSSVADHLKFLKYNQTSETDPVSQERNSVLHPSQLDGLKGIGRFNQPSLYPALVNPDFVHVSPVWKGDVSMLDEVLHQDPKNGPDINGDGTPDGVTTNADVIEGANAMGYRRGLLAFKIVGFKIDPQRPYPYLPNLLIKIVDPKTIAWADIRSATNTKITTTSGGATNVRLAR